MRRWFRSIPVLAMVLGLSMGLSSIQAQNVARLRGESATLLPNGQFLLIGGEGPHGPLSTAEILDPQSGSVRPLGSRLHKARAWHTATMLPSGQILVFGGVGSDAHVEELSEVFDPNSEQFVVSPALGLEARAYHTATLLTDGRILFAGGSARSGNVLETMAAWDYRTNSATPLATTMLVPRSKHIAILLADGSVFLWGGIDGVGNSLDFGEVFDPQSQLTRMEPSSLGLQASTLPPQLEASLPPDQSTDVPANAVPALRFSKPMSVETVNDQSITLSDPQGPVPLKIVPAEGGRLAFLTPKGTLHSGTTYILSLSGLSDGSNPLGDTTLSFTTAGTPSGGNGQVRGTAAEDDDTGSQALNSQWRSLPPLEALAGVTAISGQVLVLNGRPLGNVTLSIGGVSAATDITGRFLLAPLSSGHHVMLIDGRTANSNRAIYGLFEVGIDVTVGKTNVLPYTIWMPRLDMAHAVTIPSPTMTEVVITNPLIPGLELHLPPHSVIRDHEGKIATQISITPVPVDRPPFPLAKGVSVPLYFTIQPGDGYVEVRSSTEPHGAWLVYPNVNRAPPTTLFNFWNYDPDQKGWYVYGQGKVQPSGKEILPSPGVDIYQFTGAMVGLPDLGPPNGPAFGNCQGDSADPVDCGTGLFVLSKTDISLPDVIPIILTRTYRPGDAISRAFGIGTTQAYDIFLVGDHNPFTFADLILPDGGRVHYVRISPGTGFIDAVYQTTSSPTIFYGSTITFNEPEFAWNLRLKDGSVLVFGAVTAATIPGQVALRAVRDRHGNVLQLTRDSSYNLTAITSPNSRWVQLIYDTSNRVTQVKDNAGRTVTYAYDGLGRLSTVKDPNGGLTTYAYDPSNQMLSVKNARGIVHVTNQYDSMGRVAKQTLANGGTYQFKYSENAQGNIIETDVTDPRGIVRKRTFNSSGYVLTDTRASGKPEQQTTTYQRQTNTNLVLGVTDALGRRTAFAYDAMGNVTSVTRLAGTSNAATTAFTYEPQFSEVTSIVDPLKHTTTLAYDETGNVIAISNPLGHRWTLAHNGAGQPVSLTDPLGNASQFSYASGDFIAIADPSGNTLTRVVDGAGRMVALSDPLGNTTRYSYDPLNRLVQMLDPLQGLTRFSYDPDGNLVSITDPRNHVTRYTYDVMDRLVSRTDPLLRKESYHYDLAGNLTQFTDRRGKVTTLGYDDVNRTATVTFGSESTISNTYDQGNRLTKVVDSLGGVLTRTYDGQNHLASETTSQGTLKYTYDTAGRRTSLMVPGQMIVDYTYNAANLLTRISQGSTTVGFAYDAGNRRTALTLPNGVVATYTFDHSSRLTMLAYTRGTTTLGSLTYTYDEVGRRTSVGGNMKNTLLPRAIGSATYDAANQLTMLDTIKLTYDADGNLVGDGVNSYTWDARGQMTRASAGSTPFAGFQYDAFGRRSSKSVSGLTTHFLYDGVNVAQETAGTKSSFLTGLRADEIFSRTTSAGSSSFLADALGSTVALTDANGKIQTQYMYGPFGDTTVSGSPSTNSFQYTGRENDGTGLYYYRARYYSPAYDRFLSEDPLGLFRRRSAYEYAFSNPTNLRDPGGLNPIVHIAEGCVFVGGQLAGTIGERTQSEGLKSTAAGLLLTEASFCVVLVALATNPVGDALFLGAVGVAGPAVGQAIASCALLFLDVILLTNEPESSPCAISPENCGAQPDESLLSPIPSESLYSGGP